VSQPEQHAIQQPRLGVRQDRVDDASQVSFQAAAGAPRGHEQPRAGAHYPRAGARHPCQHSSFRQVLPVGELLAFGRRLQRALDLQNIPVLYGRPREDVRHDASPYGEILAAAVQRERLDGQQSPRAADVGLLGDPGPQDHVAGVVVGGDVACIDPRHAHCTARGSESQAGADHRHLSGAVRTPGPGCEQSDCRIAGQQRGKGRCTLPRRHHAHQNRQREEDESHQSSLEGVSRPGNTIGRVYFCDTIRVEGCLLAPRRDNAIITSR